MSASRLAIVVLLANEINSSYALHLPASKQRIIA